MKLLIEIDDKEEPESAYHLFRMIDQLHDLFYDEWNHHLDTMPDIDMRLVNGDKAHIFDLEEVNSR